ncbi:uncharacterized protein LOC143282177 [Babylonia areolata]|uniref:uncharacterized protein LOC143282177 n=1 Tax=Babylonia areolata TaxID=304850 RepID=UPI003FD4A8B2
MSMESRSLLMLLCLVISLALAVGARFPAPTRQEEEEEAAVVEEALGRGGQGGLGEGQEVEEVLPVQAVPDPFMTSLDSRLPFYGPDFLPQDLEDNVEAPFFPAPLKRGRYNRLDILKRSRLNQLIHRLLAMRGDRYSYHRASPVRFAAGRR